MTAIVTFPTEMSPAVTNLAPPVTTPIPPHNNPAADLTIPRSPVRQTLSGRNHSPIHIDQPPAAPADPPATRQPLRLTALPPADLVNRPASVLRREMAGIVRLLVADSVSRRAGSGVNEEMRKTSLAVPDVVFIHTVRSWC